MVIAPTQSAWPEKPHSTHTKLLCVLRFCAAVWRHSGHLRLVFWGGTATRRPPFHCVLYSSWRRSSNGLASRIERAGVQNRTVESRLLANLLSRLCLPALGRRRHILYLQVFDKHHGLVFADVVRRLVDHVLSDMSNFAVQLGDFGFRLLPVAGELFPAR